MKKLDLSKVIDRVEWPFIVTMREKLNFPSHLKNLIHHCLNSTNLAIIFNHNKTLYFQPTRGLHQEDLLSSFLFLLYIHGLSSMINKSLINNKWKPIILKQQPLNISHLTFADDIILFCQGSNYELNELWKVLNLFYVASGQKINFGKFHIIFNRHATQRFKDHTWCLKYGSSWWYRSLLGDSFCWHQITKPLIRTFTPKNQHENRFLAPKFLSKAGRVTMIKYVLQAIPLHLMSCLKLPQTICDLFDQNICKFYEKGSQDSRKIHRVNWKTLCKRKHKECLGLRKIKLFNQALLAKQCWILLTDPNTLTAKLFKALYHPHSSIHKANLGMRSSPYWRDILWGRELLREGIGWRIGGGSQISLRYDN